jgi:predicted transcriptional regulator
MLTNYYSVDENTSVGAFLKGVNEKKNIHYIILNTDPKSIVDIRSISLKIQETHEKLKGLKKNLPWVDSKNTKEQLKFLIQSGDYVIEHSGGYFDFIDGLKEIINQKSEIVDKKLSQIVPKEVYALNPTDTIAEAKNIFLHKKVNILPVIDNLQIIGEVRTNDLLISDLFDNVETKDLYNKKHGQSAFSLEVKNIMNSKPHTIDAKESIKTSINRMIEKKLPSIIVTQNNKLYAILSFKDIFKLYAQENAEQEYKIEFVGEDVLYEDELRMVRGFAIRTMDKITKMSPYKNLKIAYKLHGDKESSHMRKGELHINLDAGGKVLSVSKDIQTGTSDEQFNDKVKGKWNLAKLTQEALKALETQVIEEKSKK